MSFYADKKLNSIGCRWRSLTFHFEWGKQQSKSSLIATFRRNHRSVKDDQASCWRREEKLATVPSIYLFSLTSHLITIFAAFNDSEGAKKGSRWVEEKDHKRSLLAVDQLKVRNDNRALTNSVDHRVTIMRISWQQQIKRFNSARLTIQSQISKLHLDFCTRIKFFCLTFLFVIFKWMFIQIEFER